MLPLNSTFLMVAKLGSTNFVQPTVISARQSLSLGEPTPLPQTFVRRIQRSGGTYQHKPSSGCHHPCDLHFAAALRYRTLEHTVRIPQHKHRRYVYGEWNPEAYSSRLSDKFQHNLATVECERVQRADHPFVSSRSLYSSRCCGSPSSFQCTAASLGSLDST